MKDAPMADNRVQPKRSATGRTEDPSGSVMVRDPEAVVLSIVDDQLIVSLPKDDRSRDNRSTIDSRGLLPEGYIAVTGRHRESVETVAAATPTSASASAMTVAAATTAMRATVEVSSSLVPRDIPQRRTIARGQARSAGSPNVAPVIVDQRLLGRPGAVRAVQRQRHRRRIGRCLIGSVAAAAAVFGVYESSLVRVTNIVVVGNRDISSATIQQAMLDQPQPSMLSLRVEELRIKLLALPLVAEAQVWKSWPNTIEVRVRERFGVATVAASSGWVVLDQDGVVLDRRVTRPNFPSLSVDGVELTEAALTEAATTGATTTEGATTGDSLAQLIGPALASLAVAPSKLVVLVDRAMMIDGSLTLVMNRSNQSVDGDGQDVRPVEGPADQLFVTFGGSNDLRAKWEAIDIMRTRVDLSGYAVLDVSVANQPALLPKVTQQSETPTPENPQESLNSGDSENDSSRVTETSPATI